MISPVQWELTVILMVAVVDELMEVLNQLSSSFTEARANDKDILRQFYFRQNSVLVRVLLAKLPHPSQGGDAAGSLTAKLAERYQPYFLGMVGLCAGDSRKLKICDVVIGSATIRHDFGKLVRLKENVAFEHRREAQRINEGLTNEVLRFLNEFGSRYTDFGVKFGVISTGNQVTKVAGVFDYLRRQVMQGSAGDEYSRGLLALEMEAHAVAYAAEKSGVPQWLIVKGVSDFADRRKNDKHRDSAIKNAYMVMLDVVKDVICHCFVRDRSEAVEEEGRARSAFGEGDISQMHAAARKAYALGRRSGSVRRRYCSTLTQSGNFDEALQVIELYRDIGELYDDVTRSIEAAILWRQGRYREGCAILPDGQIEHDRELLYLRAMNELFASEPVDYPAAGYGPEPSRHHIYAARKLLEQALEVQRERRPAPWWIKVNLFWTLRLLHADSEDQERALQNARVCLEEAIERAVSAGTQRLYLLLLWAIAGRKDEFAEQLGQVSGQQHIKLPLETVDMVYLRLKITAGRGLLTDFPYYWLEICGWLRRIKTIGRPVRPETASVIQ